MLKISLTILFSLIVFTATAQEFFMGMGNTTSSFDYKNSKGEKLENLRPNNDLYMEAGYKLHIFTENLNIVPTLSYIQYGASGTEQNYSLDWEMAYLGTNIGLEYNLFYISDFFNQMNGFVKDREGLILYLKASFSGEFMLSGTQRINNDTYDLAGVEQFDKPFFFGRGGGGLNYSFSEDISIYGQYMFGKSFPIIASNSNDQEELSILTHQFSFGILIGINHK
ncbi:hypothetical protein R9C00_18455 [Flammeovirgaceae bacterium SG7u.111]|nr:hypothetical protein [Flammeovirgaceae bacterium SG7u.132]WPO33687.1 hypothetical protein R9C00_18455 [Flammeovirgaceae bacterium SG7u.111]